MPISFTPTRRAQLLSRLTMALVGLLLFASCRSAQSAYQFQPPASSRLAHVGTPALPPAAVEAASLPAPAPTPLVVGQPTSQEPRKPRQVHRQLRKVVARAAVHQRLVSLVTQPAAQRVQHAAGPRHVSEVGLGTTVLGVLGLVVLPISLLGLLIWGGPVWLILAGLSALAILVAYLDPFG
ncbi:hypothetical protein [Hymenobacter mucosus]|uniref:Uncharacterized protein n=1 Tax=Hymenobacter mucosus TaxID=1411120 RepID=A0A238WXG8_9BACT|nr:hypothetical protein [Hymenobacter mucosus]SNR50299.1 hypothetical protein SAMN06269173_103125 [Hymenobacter mucosus]